MIEAMAAHPTLLAAGLLACVLHGLIRSLHYMMIGYALDKSPGRWRPGPVYVHDESTGDIMYTGPDAIDVPDLMHELVEYLRNKDREHPLIRAAMAHLNLAMIHPFRDGNGRMARCVQTMVLAREGIVASPFLASRNTWATTQSRTTGPSSRSGKGAGTRNGMRSPGSSSC